LQIDIDGSQLARFFVADILKPVSCCAPKVGYPIIAYQTGAPGLKIARPAAVMGQLSGKGNSNQIELDL